MTQISLFDGSEKFIIDKPIRLIELFAGYGSQSLALKYLGVNFEHYKIAEWTLKSTQAYKDLHFGNDKNDYSKEFSVDYLIDYLFEKGVSQNYSEPMTKEQIKRLGEQKIRNAYNNIIATNNLVSVCTAKGKDLEIVDTDQFTYLLTYSFPCQDLSNAGLGKGMAKGSGTRSGLLWEVERLLDETENLPQVLVMENVPEVIGANNIEHFAKWLEKLESLGYKNKWEILNAKDFGIPQNRERCFMVSILGDYYYEFPKTIPLKLRLKDMLEKEVDEKYYLSDRAINGMLNSNFNCSTLEARTEKDGIIPTLCARDYKDPKLVIEEPNLKRELCNKLILSGLGVVVANDIKPSVRENYVRDKEKIAKSDKDIFMCDCTSGFNDNIVGIKLSPTIRAGNSHTAVYNNLLIRKLTPKECFRLMGVKDEDFENVKQNQSNASLYHLAGDSICTTVLMAIFSKMLDIEWGDKLWDTKKYIETANI